MIDPDPFTLAASDLHQARVASTWIDGVCAALGVPREALDVDAVLALAGRVAHRVARPMAPVSTFLAGYALASGAASFDEVRRVILNVPARDGDGS